MECYEYLYMVSDSLLLYCKRFCFYDGQADIWLLSCRELVAAFFYSCIVVELLIMDHSNDLNNFFRTS